MRIITTLAAAALIAGSASLAFAQTGTGSGGSTSGGGTGVSGAGSDPSAPRQNLTRPTPNTPAANKRSEAVCQHTPLRAAPRGVCVA